MEFIVPGGFQICPRRTPIPSPMKSRQVKYSKPRWILALSRKVSARVDALKATIRHQTVPVQRKIAPRKRNERDLRFETGSMNCGKDVDGTAGSETEHRYDTGPPILRNASADNIVGILP